MDYSPPGSSVHVILQARIPQSVAISYSSTSSLPRDQTCTSYTYTTVQKRRKFMRKYKCTWSSVQKETQGRKIKDPKPRIKPMSLLPPALAGRFFTAATWEALRNHWVPCIILLVTSSILWSSSQSQPRKLQAKPVSSSTAQWWTSALCQNVRFQ